MIQVDALVKTFWNIIGWPYASPGTNNAQGIDCSGAFVYAYKQFGQSIYHGSNRIIRVYCHDVQTITSVSQLKVGMAIFRARTDTSGMKAEYKPGGKYYNPALPYDYYHIGLVASVNPLQIINATPPVAHADTTLSNWRYAGFLNAVAYTDDPGKDFPAVVTAPTGNTVNLRSGPSKNSEVLYRVPLGQTVTVMDTSDVDWWYVRYERMEVVETVNGYMMQAFLEPNP